MTDYQLAIFDFDGTLIDSFGWFLGALDRLAERHRFRRIRPEELDELRGLDARTVIRRLEVAWWRLPAITRDARRLAAVDLDRLQLFNGVEAMLAALAEAGVQLAVVSTNSRENVERALGASARLIDHYDCGGGLFRKRAGLRRVLRRAGVAPARALCIGDEIRDWRAARSAGIAFGAATWGFTRREALAALGPEHVFDNIEAIARCLAPRLAAEAERSRSIRTQISPLLPD